MKKIKIIYTGGTIGSERSQSTNYAPGKKLEKHLKEDIEELRKRDKEEYAREEPIPEFEFTSLNPLLDSSSIKPEHWNIIAQEIEPVLIGDERGEFDGVLLLHGTDTMAYTASALSFMLEGLQHSNKTVVITGSQIPYYKARTDARDQIVSSLILAAEGNIPEVVLYFAGRALRGCRTTKIDAWGLGAFESPNYPELGKFGIDFFQDENIKLSRQENFFKKRDGFHSAQIQYLNIEEKLKPRIGVLKLYPGISANTLMAFSNQLDAIVIEAFGSGNGPISEDDDIEFLKAFRSISNDKILLVVTQCLKGVVSSDYNTGLVSAGAIDGKDMTTEAALTKLHYLYSKHFPFNENKEKIIKQIKRDIAGELSPNKNIKKLSFQYYDKS